MSGSEGAIDHWMRPLTSLEYTILEQRQTIEGEWM